MRSIFYRFPVMYDWGIRLLYWDGLKILKDIIGNKRSVFEPACGYGRLENYLHPDCTYSGIDLNPTFIAYGKQKKRNISLGNALDEFSYETCDVVLLCDILHHLKVDEMHRLVSISRRFAREKIVIVEPLFVHLATKKNLASRALGKIMSVMDSDGFNHIEQWLSIDEYRELFSAFKQNNNISMMNTRSFRCHHFVEMVI